MIRNKERVTNKSDNFISIYRRPVSTKPLWLIAQPGEIACQKRRAAEASIVRAVITPGRTENTSKEKNNVITFITQMFRYCKSTAVCQARTVSSEG